MKQSVYLISFSMVLAMIAYQLQLMTFLNEDVLCLLNGAKILMSGGGYVSDFLETNPPLIMYMSMPVLWCAKWFHADITFIYRLYVILLSFFSVLCSYFMLKKIFKSENVFVYSTCIILVLSYLILPAKDFGQREHFYMILFFPYLFAVIARSQQQKIHPLFSVLIGTMAALGIGLKPFFLVPLILIELYLMKSQRSLKTVLRIEAFVCAILLTGYVISVYIIYPNYFSVMLPLISDVYYPGVGESWGYIFLRISDFGFILLFIYYFLFYRNKNHQPFSSILFLTLIGTMLGFLITRQPWYYHMLPSMGISALLINFFIIQALGSYLIKKTDILFLLPVYFIFFSIMIYQCWLFFNIGVSHKNDENMAKTIAFLQTHSAKSIYCFSALSTGTCYPMVSLVNADFAGRSPLFWWMKGLLVADNTKPKIQQDKKLLISSVVEDLNRYQSQYIVINLWDEHEISRLYGDFKFVNYFSQDPEFKKAWQHYRYVTHFNEYQIYQRIG
jgi:hypothetical protein